MTVHVPSPVSMAERVRGAKVLVTGGFGFIGAWFAHLLLDRGNSVVLLDNGDYAGSTAAALGLAEHPDVSVHLGDVRSAETFAFLGDSFDYIVHAAGFLGIRRVVEQPVNTLDINYVGTQQCLDFAVRQRDLKRLIVFSTSEVYGRQAIDVGENSPVVVDVDSLRWGYAAGKIAAEFLAMAYRAEHRLPVVIVRPFNVYGPYRRGSNAMTTLVDCALRGRPLRISGDGEQRRSWCYVTDLTHALEGLLLHPDAVGERFNMGNDLADVSMVELARLIIGHTNSHSPLQITGSSEPDVRLRKPDIDKARLLIGYEPAVDVMSGIRLVVEARREELATTRPTGAVA
ncbi:NAD-dependent epimerase/dehydratase family protein [Streptomyces massasporeus]|uniref:NAD-dependent epimerase/dehydratase family protein n=1 Tax=Streptomyces massasporeus TaxID=67324 RepID=UPI0036489CBC